MSTSIEQIIANIRKYSGDDKTVATFLEEVVRLELTEQPAWWKDIYKQKVDAFVPKWEGNNAD
jgi:hypothetical protein